jgi:Copper type II ascorbate-dependent monooxygenase, C-terminal domain
MKKLRFPLLLAFAALLLTTACEKAFDYNNSEIPDDFAALPAPAAGTGFQIHVPPFPIPGNFEREWFMRLPIGNTEDIYVTKFQSKCRPGTHHLVAYGYQDENAPNQPQIGVMRDQNRSDGRGNFRSNFNMDINFFTAQSEEFTLDLPPGMAVYLKGGATMDLNSHYYNRTTQTRFGEVYLNINTVDRSQVNKILFTELIDNSDELYLPPHATTTITHTELATDEHFTVYSITSHMHQRGKLFKVFVAGGPRDGELLLEANDYKHPPQIFLADPLVVVPGIGMRTEITYENETDREITFGVTSEDEMGIAFFLYEKN